MRLIEIDDDHLVNPEHITSLVKDMSGGYFIVLVNGQSVWVDTASCMRIKDLLTKEG